MSGLTIVKNVAFVCEARGRKRLKPRSAAPTPVESERIPRIAQLLALAHRFDQMLLTGEVHSYADLARLYGVTRARMTQIMKLLDLPGRRQEDILLGGVSESSRRSR